MAYRKPLAARRAFPLVRGTDHLTAFCQALMHRTRSPRSARDIVTAWFSSWRGRKDKPANVKAKNKGWLVDRVAAWLRHHARVGRLIAMDREGERNATRYVEAPGANWQRGKASAPLPRRLD